MSAPTSFVQGTFRDSHGNPRANERITIEPVDTPFSINGDVVVSGLNVITLDGAGKFGFTTMPGETVVGYKLVQGTYRVVVSDVDAFGISVPGDGLTHDISTISVDLGHGDVLRTVVTSADLGSVLADSFSIKRTLKTDPFAIRFRLIVYGEGNILPSFKLNSVIGTLFPDSVLCLGNGNPGGLSATMDTNIGQMFHDYILGYTGSHGGGAPGTQNLYYYALGDQDWLPGDVTAVANFLQLPGNERYYVQKLGQEIDLFVLDSRPNEPDGITSSSVQAGWLKSALESSTARFKIVAFRDTFVSSKNLYTYPEMNWPFAAWGATMVLAGGPKNYERIAHASGITVVVNGCASDNDTLMDPFGAPVAGSQARSSLPGILVIDYNAYSLDCTFLDWNGVMVDKFEVIGSDTTKVSLYTQVARNQGLRVASDGLRVDYGSGEAQALEAGPANWINLQQGNANRRDIVPTLADVTSFPYLANGLILVGDDPATLRYWNRANQSWDVLATGPASIWNGSRIKLVPPTFLPPLGTITAVSEIHHTDATVQIWYSVNGAAFLQLNSFPADPRVFFGQSGNWWLASFARKTGSVDSDIVWATYHAPFK